MAETPRPHGFRITGATFLTLDGEARVHIQVAGEGFLARAAPLVARLGEQPVGRIVLFGDRGFVGVLEESPREGDRLSVGYADQELQATDVVYRGDSAAGGTPASPTARREGDTSQ